jgi:predicted transcriptional regulator of viral defense system
MKYQELNKIKKLYFGHEEIARSLGISLKSSRVSANRYVKYGMLVRIKRNIYVLKEKWKILEREDKFILANLAQVPSYISLMTALDYYEISTQMQRDFIESVAVKRTKEIDVENTIFNYAKINTNLYSGFKKENNFFIATPEKAFLDAFYLMSLGRYSFDIASIDFSRLNSREIQKLIKKFPLKTQKSMERNGYFPET